MNKNIKILLIFSVLFLIGCFPSYSVLPKEYKSVKQIQKREKAFVINKDLKSEFKILENSKIYEIVDDSTKSDLKIRPVYHWKPSRVKAHLAISFAALFLVRHLEYRVKVQYKKLSPKKIKELLLSVQHSTLVDKTRKIKYAIPSKTNVDINKLYRIMGLKKHTTPYILGKF